MKRLALCLLFACSSPSSPPVQAPPVPPPAAPEDAAVTADPPADENAPKLGEPCGQGDHCATGQSCVKYYGIAGPRGPEFKSCEIKCKADADCPAKHRCTRIADGPGEVCRPVE